LNPFVLAPGAVWEPWRLWTCHLLHFGPVHALLNLAALAVPFALLPSRRWARLGLALLLLAPLLSLALLPFLGGGQYRGASGLACAAWACAGFALVRDRATRLEGGLLLALLGIKLLAEALGGAALLPGGEGWVALPAAHRWGAVLGAGGSWLLPRDRRPMAPAHAPGPVPGDQEAGAGPEA